MKNLVTLLSLVPLILSCKKKEKDMFVHGCRVKQIHENSQIGKYNGQHSYLFEYDLKGRVEKRTTESMQSLFKYQDNKMYIYRYGANGLSSGDSITLDDKGRTVFVYSTNSERSSYTTNSYTYDPLSQVTYQRIYIDFYTESYEVNPGWQNGDLLKYFNYNSNQTEVYEYYDTLYNVGVDKVMLSDLILYGKKVFNVNRLRKSRRNFKTNALISIYSYILDPEGKVLKVTEAMANGTDSTITTIDYDCKM